MPLYEYECDACGERFEVIQKFSDRRPSVPRSAARVRAAAAVVAGDSVQGLRLVHHRLRARRESAASGRARRRRDKARAAKGDAAKGDAAKATTPKRPRRATARAARVDERRGSKTTSTRPTLDALVDQGLSAPASQRGAGPCRSSVSRYSPERLGQLRPPQREVHQRLQESQLVAGVVADAVDLAGVDRPLPQQPPQAVGQLDLARAIARRGFERREDVGRQDVAADDREVRRRVFARAASRRDR